MHEVEYFLIIAALVLSLVLYKASMRRRLTAMANHFYTNSKPYLEEMGFEGETGWCTEQPDFIDNLYKLQKPGKSPAFSDLSGEQIDQMFAYSSDAPHCVSGNQYSIAFMATVREKSNMGILALTVHRRGERDSPRDLVHVYASIPHFGKTELTTLLKFFRRRIDECEKGSDTSPLWLMEGLGCENKIHNLPYISPQDNPHKATLKGAHKLMSAGYPN